MRLFELHKNKFTINRKPFTIESAEDYIRVNCSDFLKVSQRSKYTTNLLYRGIPYMKSEGHIFTGQSPVGRKPTDSSPEGQKALDRYLRANGFTALRSNSIFCTPHRELATRFGGSIFLIFPVNGFEFTYSKTTSDIVVPPKHKITNSILYNIYFPLVQQGRQHGFDGMEKVKEYWDKYGAEWSLGEFKDAMPQFEQAVKDGKQPQRFNPRVWKNIHDIIRSKKSEFDYSYMFNNYAFTNKNLGQIFGTHSEILIHGKYIAINDKAEGLDQMLKNLDIERHSEKYPQLPK